MTLRPLILWTLLALSLAFAACGGGSAGDAGGRNQVSTVPGDGPPVQPGPGGGASDPIAEHRDQWNAAGIANYDFTLQRTVFGPPLYNEPVAIQVRAGQVVSRVYVNSGQPVAPADASWWPPIDGLFDILEEARDRPADVLTILYDARYGFPASADIDYDTGLGDDEHSFGVTAFVVR